MHSLYVLEPGSFLKKEGETLRIVRNGQIVDTIPAAGLRHLALAGRTSLTGAVLDFLIRRKIDTVFMTLDGRFQGRLLLDEAGHVDLRRKQYLQLSRKAYAVATAKAIVGAKLTNQSRLLLRRASQRNTAELRTVGAQLKALLERLDRSTDLDEIRGVEGYGTRQFYGTFGLLIGNDQFRFTGRNRRPPKDPVNGMLSFVYTLFTNEVVNGLKSCGLDPYLGTLHEIAPGRPSLACDLVEEWRIFAERMVLALINRKAVCPDDFVYRGDNPGNGQLPVEMKPAMFKAMIGSYHRMLESTCHYPPTGKETSLRWIIHSQCRRFAEALGDAAIYEPFLMPR